MPIQISPSYDAVILKGENSFLLELEKLPSNELLMELYKFLFACQVNREEVESEQADEQEEAPGLGKRLSYHITLPVVYDLNLVTTELHRYLSNELGMKVLIKDGGRLLECLEEEIVLGMYAGQQAKFFISE